MTDPTPADLAAFGASEAACYLYPGEDQQPLRAAYCAGVASMATPASADVIEGMREARPQFRETMWAEMKPDCYGGKTCDQIVPCWNVYADGDKQDDTIHEPLQLDPRRFPPGAKVIVQEPTCPECGEVRSPLFPQPEIGSLYAGPCDCGFDWDAWVLEQYS